MLLLGRSTRPRRWMYSRVADEPLTTMATLASGTSTPSLSTRPVTSFVYLAGAEAHPGPPGARQRCVR